MPFDLRAWLHRAADWSADYIDRIRAFPVRAQTRPGAIHAALHPWYAYCCQH